MDRSENATQASDRNAVNGKINNCLRSSFLSSQIVRQLFDNSKLIRKRILLLI